MNLPTMVSVRTCRCPTAAQSQEHPGTFQGVGEASHTPKLQGPVGYRRERLGSGGDPL